LEEAERLLGRPLAGVQAVDFEVEIREEGALWVLTLATVERTSNQRRERVLQGASCEEVTSAAAVAVAMVVEASEPRSESMDGKPTPEAEAPSAVEPNTQPPRPRVSLAERPKVSAALSLSFGADAGSLPGVAPGGEAGVAIGSQRWQVMGVGALYLGGDRSANGKGVDASLGVFGLLGCARTAKGAVRPLLCAGAEAGWLSGTGLGVKNARTKGAFWVAARVEAGVAVPIGGSFSLVARAGGAVPFIRREFVIDSDVLVHQPKRLAGRLALGVEFAL